MKKTVTINLNGIVFHIDEDAYMLLQHYLEQLSKQFSAEDEKEILNDIEARIAELFTEKLQNGKNVVEKPNVERVMEVLGNPSQFADNDNDDTDNQHAENDKRKRTNKRLYRDPENKILGGVAAGIAAYLEWNILLVRLLFVLFLFISVGWSFLLYLVIWIIVPEATTTAQRLEMHGEDVTIENIKTQVKNAQEYVQSDEFKSNAKNIGSRIERILSPIVKTVFIVVSSIVGFTLLLVSLSLLAAFVIALLHADILLAFLPFSVGSGYLAIIGIVSIFLLIITPTIGLFVGAIRLLSNKTPRKGKSVFGWILFTVWVISLVALISVVVRGTLEYKPSYTRSFAHYPAENRTLDGFHTILLHNGVHAEYTQDSTQQVQIMAPDYTLQNIHTEVNDSILNIYFDGETNSIFTKNFAIHIQSPTIKRIEVEGGSSITTNTAIKTSNLQLKVADLSQAQLLLDVEKNVNVISTGLSRVQLSGNTHHLDLNVSNASMANTIDLVSKTGTVNVQNAAKADIQVRDSVWIQANDAARVCYRGNPIIKQQAYNAAVVVRYNEQ